MLAVLQSEGPEKRTSAEFFSVCFRSAFVRGGLPVIDRALQLLVVLIAKFVVWVQPFLPAICCAFAWGAIAYTAWKMIVGLRNGMANIRKLHSIPCSRCRYATCDYHLKCSVHPVEAFGEDAIGCQDFEVADSQGPVPLTSLSDSAY